jgi:hypothetical protein
MKPVARGIFRRAKGLRCTEVPGVYLQGENLIGFSEESGRVYLEIKNCFLGTMCSLRLTEKDCAALGGFLFELAGCHDPG